MEMGYGKSDQEISANILEIAKMGVAGINIEDSIDAASGRVLNDAKKFASMIEYTRSKLESERLKLFINVRCDTYILDVKNKQPETIQRALSYESCGRNFVFCTSDNHIRKTSPFYQCEQETG